MPSHMVLMRCLCLFYLHSLILFTYDKTLCTYSFLSLPICACLSFWQSLLCSTVRDWTQLFVAASPVTIQHLYLKHGKEWILACFMRHIFTTVLNYLPRPLHYHSSNIKFKHRTRGISCGCYGILFKLGRMNYKVCCCVCRWFTTVLNYTVMKFSFRMLFYI